MSDIEEWRKIPGFTNYSVSSLGNVRRDRVGYSRPVKKYRNPAGYENVCLCKDGKIKSFAISRLVAGAFIPNPTGKPTVDHINRVRDDNRISNLRWATYCEQGLNRTCAIGGSGFRHITRQYGGYKFQLRRSGRIIAAVWCKSLEEALAIRDEFVLALGSEEELDQCTFSLGEGTSSTDSTGAVSSVDP